MTFHSLTYRFMTSTIYRYQKVTKNKIKSALHLKVCNLNKTNTILIDISIPLVIVKLGNKTEAIPTLFGASRIRATLNIQKYNPNAMHLKN